MVRGHYVLNELNGKIEYFCGEKSVVPLTLEWGNGKIEYCGGEKSVVRLTLEWG